MKKNMFMAAISLGAILTSLNANATIETAFNQVKSNLETEFKEAPDSADYAVIAPNGSDSTLADVTASDYSAYEAASSADGTNVILDPGVSLNIAQGTVDATDYTYLSYNEEGVASPVAGDTAVVDLSKNYTLADGVTAVAVSTSMADVPEVSLETASSEPVYKNNDGTFYLAKDSNGDIQLNGDPNTTLDNQNTFDALMASYNADVQAVSDLFAELNGYKAQNQTNFTAVGTAVTADNAAIADIVANQATFTAQNTQYIADMAANSSYVGSVAQAIDNSIANAQQTTLASAQEYADGLNATNVTAIADHETRMVAAEGSVSDHETRLGSAETSIADHETRLGSAEGTIAEHTTTLADHETRLGSAETSIADHETRLGSAEGTIAEHTTTLAGHTSAINLLNADADTEGSFAHGDALTLNSANAYTDAALTEAKAYADAGDARTLAAANAYTDEKVNALEENISGGVASAVALSSVAVSNVNKGEVSVGAGYGYYNSQSAAAFGAAMGLTDNWSVNAGAGIATGNKTQVSFRAGTNYKFKLF